MRRALGLTQTDLAVRCETTQQQIAKIETGVVDPKLSTLRRIAEALGCELTELFYTRTEFLAMVSGIVRDSGIDLAEATVLDLNTICGRATAGLPNFDPLWEEIGIDRVARKIVYLKERGEKAP